VRLVARFLCLLGALALAVSTLFSWLSVDSARPVAFPLRDLLYGVSGYTAPFLHSLAVPLLVALVLAVLAAVFGLRLLAVLAFAVTFVTTGLWTTWEAISHSRHGTSFGPGAWRTGYWAVLVALLILLLSMVLRWRRRPSTDDTSGDDGEETGPVPD
jgi:uncharacterized membrane protein